MGGFHLEKWYLDGADAAGNALIGYSARLKWKLIDLHYNGFTVKSHASVKAMSRNSFQLKSYPQVNDQQITWRYAPYACTLIKIDSSVKELLYQDVHGEISWECHFPKAVARFTQDEQAFINGFGYAEKITLTIPPWKIPITELHWGRFLSDQHTLIWIWWIGPVPKTVIVFNGKIYRHGEVSTDYIEVNGYQLSIRNKRSLRTGTILNTVFARFPAVRKLFPKSIFALRENKWLSDGELRWQGEQVATGQVIHEFVVW